MLVARGGALGASFPAHPELICTQRAELGTASSDHGLCWSKVFPPPTKPARPSSTQQSPMGCCGHSHLVCKVSPAACAPATRHTLGNNTTIIKCPRGTRGSGSSHREHLLQEEPQEKELSMGGTLSIPSWPGGAHPLPCPGHGSGRSHRSLRSLLLLRGSKQTLLLGSALQWCSK